MSARLIPAFGYLRVSGKDQIAGDGFPRQREAITGYAKAHGFRIVEWFEERAQPGKTEWSDRPAWSDMVGRMNGHRVILVESLNRLARDLMVQEHIIADLTKREVTLISVAEPDLCSDDPSRKLLRQIMGAIAEYDRAMIVSKLAGARKRMKARTGRCEGRKPYEDAEVIGIMQASRDSGQTFETIASHLNTLNIATLSGKPWIGSTVQKILARVSRESAVQSSL